MTIIHGCGKNNNPTPAAPKGPSPAILVQNDLRKIETADTTGLSQYDAETHGLITKIFGGTSNQALQNYLATRLSYFIAMDDEDVDFTPHSALETKYNKDESGSSEGDRLKKQNAVMGAANIGAGIWFASQVTKTPVTFVYHGSKIPLTSPRTGIMLIGEGYTDTATTTSGKTISIPIQIRHQYLIHEARHSDCTGGLTQDDLDIARSVTGSHDFDKRFQAKACGHLHTYCPADHAFHGLHACDSESWGAYTIGAEFLKGVLKSYVETHDWELINAQAIDYESRVLVERTGNPDMSSGGVQ